jgi:hypothetical protein
MSKDFDEWFDDHQDTYQLQQWREARMCANEAWSYQQAEIERLNKRFKLLQHASINMTDGTFGTQNITLIGDGLREALWDDKQ